MADFSTDERTLLEALIRGNIVIETEGMNKTERATIESLSDRQLVRIYKAKKLENDEIVEVAEATDEARSALGPALNSDATVERYPRSNLKSEYLRAEDF